MRKVMVVEDEPDLGDMLLDRLRASGYDPVLCENGVKAWDRLQEEGADLAILDIQMPEMNGLELCQRLRSDPRFRSLPVLMLTVRGEVEDQVEGYETGADDYLPKPFEPAVLLARLRALERRTLGSPS